MLVTNSPGKIYPRSSTKASRDFWNEGNGHEPPMLSTHKQSFNFSGLVTYRLERQTCDQAVVGSIPGRAAINSAFHRSGVGKSDTGLSNWG